MESIEERRERIRLEEERMKEVRERMKMLRRSIGKDITDHGWRAVSLQRDYVKQHGPDAIKHKELTLDQVLSCYDDVLTKRAQNEHKTDNSQHRIW